MVALLPLPGDEIVMSSDTRGTSSKLDRTRLCSRIYSTLVSPATLRLSYLTTQADGPRLTKRVVEMIWLPPSSQVAGQTGPVDIGSLFKDPIHVGETEIGNAAYSLYPRGTRQSSNDRIRNLVFGTAVPARKDDDLSHLDSGSHPGAGASLTTRPRGKLRLPVQRPRLCS